ncbi:hypothetical protein QBC38DRAFT_253660 [Podospora fimiseda]|uniref:NAD-dependent epimerase/dehydratase domain-containing protein n=1 Tax=Podospora fimiseda TaxID=252190 RepID=A0AAN7BLX5_9PEZI|nr:hypothetical protein QBC38DRAFT_253660 [Podospora fimiseda]
MPTTNSNNKGTVLLTGLNGYIAGVTAEAFLKAGYSVRGTVRSASSAKTLLDALSHYGNLSIVEIPDITKPGAFDEAVKGVSYIAHLASPVSFSFDDPQGVINTAKTGALRVLESAHKHQLSHPGSITSLVFMSSIAAVRSPNNSSPEFTHTYTEKDWNTTSETTVQEKGSAAGFEVYQASKTAAEKAVWDFRTQNNPSFSISSINPVFVTGPPAILPHSPDKIPQTAQPIYAVAAGHPLSKASVGSIVPGLIDAYVDVRDVARAVVWGVEHPKESDGERYILSAWYAPPQSVADILRKEFPEKMEQIEEGNPGKGYDSDYGWKSRKVGIDGTKVVKATGVEYIPWEKTVVDTVRFLEPLV